MIKKDQKKSWKAAKIEQNFNHVLSLHLKLNRQIAATILGNYYQEMQGIKSQEVIKDTC